MAGPVLAFDRSTQTNVLLVYVFLPVSCTNLWVLIPTYTLYRVISSSSDSESSWAQEKDSEHKNWTCELWRSACPFTWQCRGNAGVRARWLVSPRKHNSSGVIEEGACVSHLCQKPEQACCFTAEWRILQRNIARMDFGLLEIALSVALKVVFLLSSFFLSFFLVNY